MTIKQEPVGQFKAELASYLQQGYQQLQDWVSGDLELEAELAADAEVEAETMSGDVRLLVPRLPDVAIDLETYSGDIERSELLPGYQGRRRSDDRDHQGSEYSREGKGPGRVRLRTFSGDIEVKKR
jgi:DUF4097 and DUF4098 domain-containing protein YvlB